MRTDLDFFASLFDVFLSSKSAFVFLGDFTSNKLFIQEEDISEEFLFHISLAIDNDLIVTKEKGVKDIHTIKDLGIHTINRGNGKFDSNKTIPWRLTQKGHDFALALENKSVLNELKNKAKNMPFHIILNIATKLSCDLVNKILT